MSAPAIDRFASGPPDPTRKARTTSKKRLLLGADAEQAARKPIFKNRMFLIVVAIVFAAAGLAYKVLVPSTPGKPVGGDVVAMDATTVNLADGHYLKISIAIQLVQGKAAAADFHTSEAAELTINEFSDRTVRSLSTNPARRKLTDELTRKIMNAYAGEVFDVFVTEFVTD